MKKILPFACLAFFALANLFAQNDPIFEELVCKEAASHNHFLNPPVANILTEDYDLKYARFEWAVDPSAYQIGGTVTTYFQTLEDGFSALHFDFSSQLAIDQIKYHGQNLTFTQSGDFLLTIPLPSALPASTLDSVSITYHGTPPSTGFGSFNQGNHGGAPIVWTLSEPYGSQDWWPCKNGLTDKLDSIDVIVTCPDGNRVASNGSLASEKMVGTNKIFHWKHRYPITPYLVAIAVTNYDHFDLNVPLTDGTQLPMVNYAYPEDLQYAMDGTADLVKVLSFYDSLFVQYPFAKEKYGHAQFGWGGGMEHQTMSFVTDYSLGLLAHELAHQWYGDMITCGSWEHIWLNEGFATYLEGLARERFSPDIWKIWKNQKVGGITSKPDGSVKVDDTTSVNRIFSGRLTYSKGAYLLHMLRWKLGDAAFFQGMRDYSNDRKYQFGLTGQLQAHLEQASGISLAEFFEDWFEGQGFPSYQVVWQQTGSQFSAKIDQSVSMPGSVDFFEIPVPLRLIGTGGETQDVRFDLTASGQFFGATVNFPVADVLFDPELWLISANNQVEKGTVATENLSTVANFQLLPNPTDGFLKIIFDEKNAPSRFDWTVLNTLGQSILTGKNVQGRAEINAGNLPGGLYHLLLIDEKGRTQTRSFSKN